MSDFRLPLILGRLGFAGLLALAGQATVASGTSGEAAVTRVAVSMAGLDLSTDWSVYVVNRLAAQALDCHQGHLRPGLLLDARAIILQLGFALRVDHSGEIAYIALRL